MLVKDGVVEKMFIEPDEPGDPVDAETMLSYINPEAVKPKSVPCLRKWVVHASAKGNAGNRSLRMRAKTVPQVFLMAN